MEIKRDLYLNKLIESVGNGMIKIVTGMRRCGKSYLLFKLFYDNLRNHGIDDGHIIKVDLEDRHNRSLCDPDNLLAYIDSKLTDAGHYYVLLDEIQKVAEFEDVLNSYLKMTNVDVYVTGSNSHLLSKDVITEFRGRGHEIRLHPLCFREIMSAKEGQDSYAVLRDYMVYGGLPQVVNYAKPVEKEDYLKALFAGTYLRDIKERYKIKDDADLEELVDVIASSIGGLTNPLKLQNTFRSVKHSNISFETIKRYLDIIQDAFLIEKAVRYDIKGKRYISTPAKYYFEDLGMRNARLNFRQAEEAHLMENLIYNELRVRGLSVDVGHVEMIRRDKERKLQRSCVEVDFVCNQGYKRIYIQSAFNMPSADKVMQEKNSLRNIEDNFPKVIIVGGLTPTHMDDDGIVIMNILDFLMDVQSLDSL